MLSLQIVAISTLVVSSFAATLSLVSQLREGGYDFIIAGGGTAGLTVGDRLSEAFPDRRFSSVSAPFPLADRLGTVLVVEYGTIEYAPRIGGPPSNYRSASGWAIKSLPNPGINNRTVSVQVGKVCAAYRNGIAR